MASPGTQQGTIRFGLFELDPVSRELRKRGIPVKLQPQQFAVLLMLTQRAGQIVSREEIHQHIWGNDTFVDFERGINFSINQIRTALGDDAEKPRYVETIPRRGYRFIAAIENDEPRRAECFRNSHAGHTHVDGEWRSGSDQCIAIRQSGTQNRPSPASLLQGDSDQSGVAGNSRCRTSGLPRSEQPNRAPCAVICQNAILKDAYHPTDQHARQILGPGIFPGRQADRILLGRRKPG